jgi:hypothetical protein
MARSIEHGDDFAWDTFYDDYLTRDRQRELLRQLIRDRFEELLDEIEESDWFDEKLNEDARAIYNGR